MFTPALLKDLLVTIQSLQQELMDSHTEKVSAAWEAYQELLDGCYEESRGKLAPQQYKASKDDPEYFLRLIELAYHEKSASIDIKQYH